MLNNSIRPILAIAFLLTASLIELPEAKAQSTKKINKLFSCVTDQNGNKALYRGEELQDDTERKRLSRKLRRRLERLEDIGAPDRRIDRIFKKMRIARRCRNKDGDSPSPSPTIAPTPVSGGTLSLLANDNPPAAAFKVFSKKVSVFGVYVFATSEVSDANTLHAAKVLAQYLDNNEDGEPDNAKVINAMLEYKAALIMFKKDGTTKYNKYINSDNDGNYIGQPLFDHETHPDAIEKGIFDYAWEEVLHLVTMAGYAFAYPSVWGEDKGTQIANKMEASKASGHYNPFANEPGMDYPSQISEYIYWALTSMLGVQDMAGRYDEISSEWSLNTREKVQSSDPAIFEMLSNSEYKFATVIPDANYMGQ